MHPAKFVQARQQPRGTQAPAIQRHRVAAGEFDFHYLRFVRRRLGRHGPAPDALVRLGPGILQVAALVGNVQQVGVHGIRRLVLLLEIDRYVVIPAIGQQLLPGVQVPLPPRSNHLDVGIQRIGAQLEPHLVVALAGCAVRDGVGAGFFRDFHQAPGDQRPGNGGAQQVFPFIQRIRAEHWQNVVPGECLLQVFDVDFLHAHRSRLGARRLHLLALADVGRKGHHLRAAGLLQPSADYRRIQPPGVSQHNFLRALHPRTPVTAPSIETAIRVNYQRAFSLNCW